MAAKYLTVTYVTNQVGGDFLRTAFDQEATAFTTAISASFQGMNEAASAIIGTYLRKMGYSVPSTSTSAEDVKSVTFAAFYEMLVGRPENSLALPDTWAGHPSKVLYEDLKTGDAHLSLTGSAEAAMGGAKFSESSTSVSTQDGSRQSVFSRKNMAGW